MTHIMLSSSSSLLLLWSILMTTTIAFSLLQQQKQLFSYRTTCTSTSTISSSIATGSTSSIGYRNNDDGIFLPLRRMVNDMIFEDFKEPEDNNNNNDQNENEKDIPISQPTKLGIPILLNPMTSEDAMAIKLEATEMVNNIVAAGMDELQSLRQQLKDDIQTSTIQRGRQSQIQMMNAQTKLMNQIDTLTNDFLQSTATSRTTTKLAALADQTRPTGQGIEIGSWGIVNGRYVTTTDGENVGLLGSSTTTSSSSSSSSSSDTNTNTIRMIVIADPTSDPYAKLLLGPLEASLQNVLISSSDADSDSSSSKNFEMLTYAPTSTIPIGNNQNAAAILIFATSLNDVTTLQSIMDRIYRKTLTSSTTTMNDGTTTTTVTSVPPTQIILITTIGTTRTEKMPFSFQNLMNGNQLTKRRQMEEYIVRYVHQQHPSLSSSTVNSMGIDYTICHLGNDIKGDTKDIFQLLPGDTIDGGNGIVPIDTAVTVLTHAIALQPYARNATFSCTGKLPSTSTTDPVTTSLILDDAFLKLDGPEILRIDEDDTQTLGSIERLDVLTEYIAGWANLLCTTGKGLTTPVRCEIVSNNKSIFPSGVIQQASSIIRILFQPTNTGKYYVSKDDEREVANDNKKSDGKSTATSTPSTRTNPRFTKEGGIEFIIEVMQKQQLRIRVKRCNYNYDTTIKELSEQTIMSQFKKSIEVWKNRS